MLAEAPLEGWPRLDQGSAGGKMPTGRGGNHCCPPPQPCTCLPHCWARRTWPDGGRLGRSRLLRLSTGAASVGGEALAGEEPVSEADPSEVCCWLENQTIMSQLSP